MTALMNYKQLDTYNTVQEFKMLSSHLAISRTVDLVELVDVVEQFCQLVSANIVYRGKCERYSRKAGGKKLMHTYTMDSHHRIWFAVIYLPLTERINDIHI